MSIERDAKAEQAAKQEAKFRKAAKAQQIDGELEIDHAAEVSPSEDDDGNIQGAYVQAWIYVPISEIEDD